MFAIPLCGIFLWSDPLWSYGMTSGFAEKQFFKLRKIVFFAHAWTASNPRKIYMWIDLGTWNIAFPNNLKKNLGFAEAQCFKLRKVVFIRTCLDCFQPTQNPYIWEPETLLSPRTWRKLRLLQKTIFQAPKKCFFAHATKHWKERW